MTGFDGLERDLTVWFGETTPHEPEYLDDILTETARSRQRPRWTFPTRWLPVLDVLRLPAPASPIPWRSVGLVLLLLTALVAGAIVAGSVRTRVPDPFGPAANGWIAYEAGGDIYTADPATGQTQVIVTGPERDSGPEWSRDGTRLVFRRVAAGGGSLLLTANPDGTGLTQITPFALTVRSDKYLPDYAFSPDGNLVVFVSATEIHVVRADGTGEIAVIAGGTFPPTNVAFRPGDLNEVSFVTGDERTLVLVNADGSNRRTLVETPENEWLSGAYWSPDGSQILYHRWRAALDLTARGHLLTLSDGDDRLLDPAFSGSWDLGVAWSNDGERVAVLRGYTGMIDDTTVAIVPVDGSDPAVETDRGLSLVGECCPELVWAPDDTAILMTPIDGLGMRTDQVLIDPGTAEVREVPWSSTSDPTWQRRAP